MNPMIALNARAPQFEVDPNAESNRLLQFLKVSSMMDESDMNRLKTEEYKRGVERSNRLREVLAQDYAKPEELETALLRGGFVDEYSKMTKDRREGQKFDAEAQDKLASRKKTDLETSLKKMEHAGSVLSQAKDPQSYSMARMVLKRDLNMDLPEQFDPGYIQATIAGGQTLTQRLQAEHQRMTLEETKRHNVTSETETGRHNRAGEGIQIRGQNMVDARSREATMATMTKPFEVTGPDGNPVLVQQDKQGNIRPVQGYAPKGGNKTLTDSQAKANLFGTRMKESDRILSGLEGKYSPLAVNSKMAAQELPLVGGVAGAMGNLTMPANGQQAEQAMRDFINAVLRRESGAVITAPEFDNARKQYFPQPGDSKQVLEQKARNRKLAISGMEAEVPGGFRTGPSLTTPSRESSGKVQNQDLFNQADAILNGGR
jgi:hypothetical protein